MKALRYLAVVGDVVFALWILYNAIDDGFSAIGTAQGIIPLGLLVLLIINTIVLFRR